MEKLKLGVFAFTSCYGCQLQILNLEEKILPLLNFLDIQYWRLVQETPSNPENIDIAIIEGSITNNEELEEVKKIREHAKIVMTIGACAHLGGVQGMRNIMDNHEVHVAQYGDNLEGIRSITVQSVPDVIKVDAIVRGCPINKDEFVKTVFSLLAGRSPREWRSPVCNECKIAQNECFYERELDTSYCMGPITEAGCGARCPSNGVACDGCRGWTTDPSVKQQYDELKNRGLKNPEIVRLVRRYSGGKKEQTPVIESVVK
jgi:coenzyme F420-reducing hydrogenase gamma subunit